MCSFLAVAVEGQVSILVEPANIFVIHPRKLSAQHIVNAYKDEPSANVGCVNDTLNQIVSAPTLLVSVTAMGLA